MDELLSAYKEQNLTVYSIAEVARRVKIVDSLTRGGSRKHCHAVSLYKPAPTVQSWMIVGQWTKELMQFKS